MHTVRKVLPHEYEKYRTHLKSLDLESRTLRFASSLTDEIIDNLCDKWFEDKDKHVLFAIEDDGLDFVAVAHIALEGDMELAFSVLKSSQGQGMGDKLMNRVIQYCRTHNILHGNMVCLSRNSVIKHLCTKHGIHMHSESGETLAEIDLDVPNATTFFNEVADSNLAVMDYFSKRTLLPWTLVHKKFDSLS
jgi:GNAT superfamily N-acetyltransferase